MIPPGSTESANPPTLGDILRARATDCENRTAIEFEGRATSYAELRDGAFRIANALIASGLEPGDRVAVLALLQTWGTAARRHPVGGLGRIGEMLIAHNHGFGQGRGRAEERRDGKECGSTGRS